MKKWLLYAPLLVLVLAGCSKPAPPQYVGVDRIGVLSVGLAESIIGMDIRMFNPNNYRLQLKSADMEIFVNNTLLGTTKLDSMIQIPRKDTFSVPVKVHVQTLSGATRLLQSLSDTAVLLKVTGTAKFGKGGVFVNYPLSYEGMQSLR